MMYGVRRILWISFTCFTVIFAIALYTLVAGWPSAGKWFGTASAAAGIVAVLQLEVSGFFDKLFEEYSDDEKYPFGPPSHVNREITDIPDARTLQTIRHWMLFEPRTALYFALASLLLSIPDTWL